MRPSTRLGTAPLLLLVKVTDRLQCDRRMMNGSLVGHADRSGCMKQVHPGLGGLSSDDCQSQTRRCPMGKLGQSGDQPGIVARARAIVEAMTPAERHTMIASQRRRYLISEAAFGSEEDEAAYRSALISNDQVALNRQRAESSERAAGWLKEQGL
jgi:hypothetical protein